MVSWVFEAALGALGLRVTRTPRDDGLSQPFSTRRWLILLLVMQCRGGGLLPRVEFFPLLYSFDNLLMLLNHILDKCIVVKILCNRLCHPYTKIVLCVFVMLASRKKQCAATVVLFREKTVISYRFTFLDNGIRLSQPLRHTMLEAYVW
jgi:hypothetical protein